MPLFAEVYCCPRFAWAEKMLAFAPLRLGARAPCGPVRPHPFVRGIELPPALRLGGKRCLPSRSSGSALARRACGPVRPRPLVRGIELPPALRLGERITARASLGRKEMLAFAWLWLGAPRRVAQCVPAPLVRGIELPPALRLGGKADCLRFAQARWADCPRSAWAAAPAGSHLSYWSYPAVRGPARAPLERSKGCLRFALTRGADCPRNTARKV